MKTKCGNAGWRRRGAIPVALFLLLGALAACDGLLDVDLPGALTDDVLEDPEGAETLVNSVIANFECGYSAFTWISLGHEDVIEEISSRAFLHARYRVSPPTGPCDVLSETQSFYDQFAVARSMAFDAYDRLSEWTDQEVPNRERLQAVAALYAGATLDHFGEFYCEMTVDDGPLMTPDETLGRAEEWVGRALNHISNVGDFEVSHGASSSAETMAYGLRARIRWARGDFAGALQDAERVPLGFEAWVVRDAGVQRRNKAYEAGTRTGWGGIVGINDWWDVVDRTNPATGEPWPDPVPFTGYLFLGILEDDGRAISDDGYPVRWAEEHREMGEEPTPLDNGAVPDSRVSHFKKGINGPEPMEVPAKYSSEEDDIPLVNWEEVWLIRAEIEGGQTAIDLVNDIRDHHGLPRVTYADPGDPEQIRSMILEEKRRSLFVEARYLSTKIQNPDVLWFPRGRGRTPSLSFDYDGGVRFLMPNSEYELNPNLSLADRATGCDPAQAPVAFE